MYFKFNSPAYSGTNKNTKTILNSMKYFVETKLNKVKVNSMMGMKLFSSKTVFLNGEGGEYDNYYKAIILYSWEISGFHGSEYEHDNFLGCSAV
jgi:hypothetical protein